MKLERTADKSVGLEDAEDDVEQPEEEKEQRGEALGQLGPAELGVTKDREWPPHHQEDDGGDGAAGVDDDTEGESPRVDLEASLGIL